jgi:thioredoxin
MNSGQHKSRTSDVGEVNFESDSLQSKQPVLVEFWAPWSRPCHVLDMALEEVATARAGIVKIIKVNADDNPDLSLLYDIQSIPTLLYFVEGSLRARLVGTASKEAILSKLQGVCGGDSTSPSHEPNKT